MNRERFINAEELASELGMSKPYAYKLIREMNDELKKRGLITISGKVYRRFFEEKFFGTTDTESRGQDVCL